MTVYSWAKIQTQVRKLGVECAYFLAILLNQLSTKKRLNFLTLIVDHRIWNAISLSLLQINRIKSIQNTFG